MHAQAKLHVAVFCRVWNSSKKNNWCFVWICCGNWNMYINFNFENLLRFWRLKFKLSLNPKSQPKSTWWQSSVNLFEMLTWKYMQSRKTFKKEWYRSILNKFQITKTPFTIFRSLNFRDKGQFNPWTYWGIKLDHINFFFSIQLNP